MAISIYFAPSSLRVGQSDSFSAHPSVGTISSVISSNPGIVTVVSFDSGTSSSWINLKANSVSTGSATITVTASNGDTAQIIIPVHGIDTAWVSSEIGVGSSDVGVLITTAAAGGAPVTVGSLTYNSAFKIAENASHASASGVTFGELIPFSRPKWNICSVVSPGRWTKTTRNGRQIFVHKLKTMSGALPADKSSPIDANRYTFGLGFFYDKPTNSLHERNAPWPDVYNVRVTVHYLDGVYWAEANSYGYPQEAVFRLRLGRYRFEDIIGGANATKGQYGIAWFTDSDTAYTEVDQALTNSVDFSTAYSHTTSYLEVKNNISAVKDAALTNNARYRPMMFLRSYQATDNSQRVFFEFLIRQTPSFLYSRIMHTSPALGTVKSRNYWWGGENPVDVNIGVSQLDNPPLALFGTSLFGRFDIINSRPDTYWYWYVKEGDNRWVKLTQHPDNPEGTAGYMDRTLTLPPYTNYITHWDVDKTYDFLATDRAMLTGEGSLGIKFETNIMSTGLKLGLQAKYPTDPVMVPVRYPIPHEFGSVDSYQLHTQLWEPGVSYVLNISEITQYENYQTKVAVYILYEEVSPGSGLYKNSFDDQVGTANGRIYLQGDNGYYNTYGSLPASADFPLTPLLWPEEIAAMECLRKIRIVAYNA